MYFLIISGLKRALSLGLVFIVFGFVDNFIMIVAGDAIDMTLTARLGFSTLFAAGLGNTLSDGFGISVGRGVERYFEKHLPKNHAPQSLIITAETIGIILGCLLGLLPLVFL